MGVGEKERKYFVVFLRYILKFIELIFKNGQFRRTDTLSES